MRKITNIQVKTIQNLSVDKEILFDDLFQLILLFCTKTSQNSHIHTPPLIANIGIAHRGIKLSSCFFYIIFLSM